MRGLAATLWLLLAAGVTLAGPREAFAAALADARTLPPEECQRTRYLWHPGGLTDESRAVYAFHVNQLSRSPELRRPRVVGPDLLAVYLDDYGWRAATWEKLADVEPYFAVRVEEVTTGQKWYPAGRYTDGSTYPAGYYPEKKRKIANAAAPWLDARAAVELQARTGSLVPVVRADWWLALTCRSVDLRNRQTGAGYYEWLGVKDRKAFESLVDLDAAASDRIGRHLRAVAEVSGVAQHGRQIVRLSSRVGAYWMTLDAKTLEPDNLPTELLKPGVFKHDAEEIFAALPNGLWAFGLFDAKGGRQDTAPDFIGPDDSPLRAGRDGRIHVCLSCVRCHVEDGLRPVGDWARRTFAGRVELASPDRRERDEFRRLYLGDLARQMDRDRLVFREALVEIGGPKWTAALNAAAFARQYDAYAERPVTLARLALELGEEPHLLGQRLKAGTLPLSLAALLNGGTLRREIVEDFMPLLMGGR